ncbi:MAG: TetR/AcrR family transcriptional regulator [Acidimicrobiia bacterium]|nr:TetR/AcrR family transcriptional regulator [Acidimicrobiia bacterium]
MSTLAQNQAARRRRVMDAALNLATQGGFDSVQMRDVASEADVALGTLYRYFPSKEYLLVSILAEDVDMLAEETRQHPPDARTRTARVQEVMRRAVRLLPERQVLHAHLRALTNADPEVGALVGVVNEAMTSVITAALHEGEPTEEERQIARVIQQVWTSSMMGWVSGLHDRNQILDDILVATALLLRDT